MSMFSPSLEIVLTVAYREATSRRHAYLTLEHLLYALAHDPSGEEILAACGAQVGRLRSELKKFLTTGIEKLPEGTDEEPTQTLAFQRVLQRTALHVQSAGKEEAGVGDALAALLQEGR